MLVLSKVSLKIIFSGRSSLIPKSRAVPPDRSAENSLGFYFLTLTVFI